MNQSAKHTNTIDSGKIHLKFIDFSWDMDYNRCTCSLQDLSVHKATDDPDRMIHTGPGNFMLYIKEIV